MSSLNWLREEAAKAMRDNPSLISGHELERRRAAAKDAERAARRDAEALEELKKIRRLLEQGKA